MNTLVIFAKYPEIGKVKTRLAKDIGEVKSRDAYQDFISKLIEEHKGRSYKLVIAFTPSDKKESFIELFGGLEYIDQGNGNLGDKLYSTFNKLEGNVIIIGSDLPDLSYMDIENAFIELDKNDIIIGPAYDGGYYLIGMKKAYNIFSDIEWSTEKVFGKTIEKIESIGLKYKILQMKRDIDTIEDYKEYLKRLSQRTRQTHSSLFH